MLGAERDRLLESWIEAHKAILFKVARVYGATHSDREDLFQEMVGALLFSWTAKRSQDIPDDSLFGGWFMYLIVGFAVLSLYRGWDAMRKAKPKLVARQRYLRELLDALGARE
jgi:hypothetical protein